MRTLLKNGLVLNVFLGELVSADLLLEDGRILGVGDYASAPADEVCDLAGRTVVPGFIDGHIHIESTMLSPAELARVVLPHGTTAVVADPHEIANVAGRAGISYMLEASEGLPLDVFLMLPSCVPATPFCESGAVLEAKDLRPFYDHPRVLGLAEVMNYVGVLAGDAGLCEKIADAKARGLTVNGHAPLLSGAGLDAYIAAGIGDDHECTSFAEARERIAKGQRVMVREGTAAKNLEALLPLFDPPYANRCLLVSDDKHPADLLQNGHLDHAVRKAVSLGKSAIHAIRMATLGAAECFGLKDRGAIAPGYLADLVVLDSLESMRVTSVYKNGRLVARDGQALPFTPPTVSDSLARAVEGSFNLAPLTAEDFRIDAVGKRTCRVIGVVAGELLTNELTVEVDFDRDNGIDPSRDLLKLAVIERHRGTGHRGLGLVQGIGLSCGAIASSVSHDSHNLIVIGTSEADMALAANRVAALGGGCVSVKEGRVLCEMPLPLGGLMSKAGAQTVAAQNEAVRESLHALGVPQNGIEPFMNMAFLSLPVIPHLKMTTTGLFSVDGFTPVSLFV